MKQGIHRKRYKPPQKVAWYRFILPKILSVITRRARYLPDVEWNDESLVYNAFRVYELIFWRGCASADSGDKIRAEGASGKNADGSEWHESYTYENSLVRFEYWLRAQAVRRVRITVNLPELPIWLNPLGAFAPQLAYAGKGVLPEREKSPFLFAIALDAAAGFTAYSDTLAHTITGSNPFLYVLDVADSGSLPSSWVCNWNTSEAMTGQSSIDSDAAGGDRWSRVWLLGAPTTGTHNIVASNTGTNFHMLGCISYSGAQSTSVMDSGATSNSSGNATIVGTTTVVASNCWLVTFCNYTSGSMVSGTVRGTRKDSEMNADSNGTVGTGSQSLEWNKVTSPPLAKVQIISFTPLAATNVTVNPSVLAAAFSIPAIAVSTAVSIASSVLSAVFSIPSASVSGGATVSASVLSATFSTPAPDVSGGATASPSVLAATFSIPTIEVVTPDAQASPSVLSATFSIPAVTVTAEQFVTVSASVLSATFSLPSATAEATMVASPAVLSATFSVQSPTVTAIQNVSVAPSVLAATFSLPSSTVTAEISVTASPSVLTLTFSTPSSTVTAIRHVTLSPEVLALAVSMPVSRISGDFWQPQYTTVSAGWWSDKY